MNNKLFKLLVKMQTQLLNITGNLLNPYNELLEKSLIKNENGEFIEDKNHWNATLGEIGKLANLIYKFEIRALAITDKSEIQILKRFLVVDFLDDYEILCDIEEKHLKSQDARTKCLNKTVFFFTYILEIVENTEKQLGISSEPSDKPSKQLRTNLTDNQRDLLYDLLVKAKFIPGTTNKEGFIWAFGTPDENQPEYWQSLIWIKNKQLLRELLVPFKRSDLKIADIERTVLLLFKDLKGNPIVLAKSRPIPSTDSDLVFEIHKKIATI